ncbi:vexin [Liasis olivaceus]
MYQIYSCSDENLEVFSVVSSKFKSNILGNLNEPTSDCKNAQKKSWKNTGDEFNPIQGTESFLPFTGSGFHRTASLLRKIWMTHRKKLGCLGATNSAFEAD